MAFDITPYVDKTPAEVRALCRDGVFDFPTAGMCRGYAQANLVILPPEYAVFVDTVSMNYHHLHIYSQLLSSRQAM